MQRETTKQQRAEALRGELARLAARLQKESRRRAAARSPAAAGRLAEPAAAAPRPPVGVPRRTPCGAARVPPPAAAAAGAVRSGASRYRIALEEAIESGREVVTALGPLFEVRHAVADIPGAEELDRAFTARMGDPLSPMRQRLCRIPDSPAPAVEDLVFMDIETTGLNASPLFLIGVMTWEDGGFVVRQFFARHYAEEAAVIARFADDVRGRRLLVTFNGKSFDWPYIRLRAIVNGLPSVAEPHHLDLLHESRRVWKPTLPNCRLQTIERHICGRTRTGDIPGSEIPAAYHAYVRTQDAWQMTSAIHHNMLDLVTLADIMTRMPDGPPSP